MPIVQVALGGEKHVTLNAPIGLTLLEILQGYHTGHIPAPCGGRGTCHKCRVKILTGLEFCPVTDADRVAFTRAMLQEGWRLACRVILPEGAEILIEHTAHKTAEMCETTLQGRSAQLSHKYIRVTVHVAQPTLENQLSDSTRLKQAVASCLGMDGEFSKLRIDFSALRELPSLLRSGGGEMDVLLDGETIIAVRPPSSGRLLGAAVDLGTTTVALSLCDLVTGEILHTASMGNLQGQYGDDVISRISEAAKEGGLHRLLQASKRTLGTLLKDACRAAETDVADVVQFTVAGNAVMQHLFAGVSPAGIGESPFITAFSEGCIVRSRDVLDLAELGQSGYCPVPEAPVYILPVIGPYVGGDITAGIVSQYPALCGGNVLLIDVGTNGEIVLHSNGKIYACSTAAGPAFEGARISCGMRACGGAISHLALSDSLSEASAKLPAQTSLSVETINDEPPLGLCGSGLLDAVAVLLDAGLLDETGAFVEDDELAEDYPVALRALLCDDGAQLTADVLLTRKDVREFQLACAAIQAGARVLLEEAGIDAAQLDGVLLAGGFGSRLSVQSALRTGLIPPGVTAQKVYAVGNSSLAGAVLCLLQHELRDQAEDICAKVCCLELSGRADFQEFYLEAMEFPEA